MCPKDCPDGDQYRGDTAERAPPSTDCTPRPLRHRVIWVALGWSLVAAVVWISLTPSPPDVGLASQDKLEHVMAYLVLASWFGALYTGGARAFYTLALALMGVGIEFLQEAGGVRQLEAADMIANALGALAGWLLSHTAVGRSLHVIEHSIDRLRRRV